MNKAIITMVSPHQEVQSYHVSIETFMQVWTLLNDNKQPMVDSLDKPILLSVEHHETEKVSISDIEHDAKEGYSSELSCVISDGTKNGYCELRFSNKPIDYLLNDLKYAGYHWSPMNKCWYGKLNKIPSWVIRRLDNPEYIDEHQPIQDKPEPGKVYQITGKREDKCISNGDSWHESEVKDTVQDNQSFQSRLADLLKTL